MSLGLKCVTRQHSPASNSYSQFVLSQFMLCMPLKPNFSTLAGSELVQSWFEAGSKPNSITLSGSNQLRTSSEPARVMEFGF